MELDTQWQPQGGQGGSISTAWISLVLICFHSTGVSYINCASNNSSLQLICMCMCVRIVYLASLKIPV